MKIISGFLLTLAAIVIFSLAYRAYHDKGRTSVNIDIVTIDGCQYIATPAGGGSYLVHKGNCTNNFHLK